MRGLNRIPCEEGMSSKTEWSTDRCINFLSVAKIEFNRWQLAKTQICNDLITHYDLCLCWTFQMHMLVTRIHHMLDIVEEHVSEE